jgi:hypothetical protein
MSISRRALLGGLSASAVAALARGALGDLATDDLELRDLAVEGDRTLGRRFTLLVPRHLAEGERAPLLVLLHGLGETGDPRAGVYAWLERYGLGTAYARLRRPPVVRTSCRPDWTDARLAEVNASLAARPFRGLVLACPYTPNVFRLPAPGAALDEYARWLVEVVVPRARRDAPVLAGAAHTGLDGCSLGGFVGLEAFLRRPEAFGAWGGVQSAFGEHRAPALELRVAAAVELRVQSAFGEHRAPALAERLRAALAKAGPRPLHLETSTGDPFHDANAALAAELGRRGVAHELRVLPGPHDQPWLREAGTIEMLLWHDRALR